LLYLITGRLKPGAKRCLGAKAVGYKLGSDSFSHHQPRQVPPSNTAVMDQPQDGQLEPPSLLLLPYELRAKIYEEVISSETPPPQDPAQASERSREPLHSISAFYPKEFRHPCSSLMRTSKGIHDEVKALLDAESRQQKPKCKLDLLVVRKGVYPTWTMPPRARSAEAFDLDVDLRLLDLTDPNPLFMANAWPGIVSQPLMVILNRLVAYGPQFSRPLPNFEGLRIHNLTMHVRYCASKRVAPRKARQERRSTPEYVFGSLSHFMEMLEAQGVLYGKVTEMRLVCDRLGESRTVFIYPPVHPTEDGQRSSEYWDQNGYAWGPDPNAYRADRYEHY